MIPRQSQYGRGKGSYKEGLDKSHTPEKGGQKSSFRAKKNINGWCAMLKFKSKISSVSFVG